MPHQQVILMNGPPRSGKDTGGVFVCEDIANSRALKIAEPLKACVASLFGLSFMDVRRWEAHGSIEKDEPQIALHNMTWREALIWMAETCVKPQLGKDFFGQAMAHRLREPTSVEITIITDCGFQEDVLPIITAMGAANCHLFRLHRAGCDYGGDSRGYLFARHAPAGLRIEDINNNHDRQMFRIQILRRVNKILGRKMEFKLV